MKDRKITFDGEGSMVIETPGRTDVISTGVVLLEMNRLDEALAHGWEDFGGTIEERGLGLMRVRKPRLRTMPPRESAVDGMLKPWLATLQEPELLSVLYDAEMMPEQCRTNVGALHLVLVCILYTKWKEARRRPSVDDVAKKMWDSALAKHEDQTDLEWHDGRMESDLRTMAREVLEMLS